MTEITLDSVGEHQDLVDQMHDAAWAIPADMVRTPDIPIDVYIKEAKGFISAAREHEVALSAVGMPAELIGTMENRTLALDAVQGRWMKERNKGRSEKTLALIEHCSDLRADTLAASDLALRNSPDGQRRLANIREGEGLADMVADLRDLSLLVQDGRSYFEAIKMHPEQMAEQLTTAQNNLSEALAKETADKSLSVNKELRDRYYTMSLEPLRELRAFADFAFRKDKGNNRRFAFTSAYRRRINRRFARNRNMNPSMPEHIGE